MSCGEVIHDKREYSCTVPGNISISNAKEHSCQPSQRMFLSAMLGSIPVSGVRDIAVAYRAHRDSHGFAFTWNDVVLERASVLGKGSEAMELKASGTKYYS